MMIGHALLAFALVALVAHRAGWDPRRAAAIGVVAGAFGTIPDVDMLYAVTGLLGPEVDGVFEATGAFWGTSTVVHRTATHSVVIALPAAAAFAAFVVRSRRVPAAGLGAAVLAAIVAISYLVTGGLAAAIMATFAVSGVGVALATRHYTDLDARSVFGAAAFGLVSHPFGDVVTGEPPALLYPLDTRVLNGRVALHDDATLHLLGAFAIELTVVWLALFAVATLWSLRLHEDVHPAAGLGVAYGAVVLWLPPPTLSVSYHFVFSILGVGTTLGTPGWVRSDGPGWLPADRRKVWGWVVTTVAAVTFALVAYTVGYSLL